MRTIATFTMTLLLPLAAAAEAPITVAVTTDSDKNPEVTWPLVEAIAARLDADPRYRVVGSARSRRAEAARKTGVKCGNDPACREQEAAVRACLGAPLACKNRKQVALRWAEAMRRMGAEKPPALILRCLSDRPCFDALAEGASAERLVIVRVGNVGTTQIIIVSMLRVKKLGAVARSGLQVSGKIDIEATARKLVAELLAP